MAVDCCVALLFGFRGLFVTHESVFGLIPTLGISGSAFFNTHFFMLIGLCVYIIKDEIHHSPTHPFGLSDVRIYVRGDVFVKREPQLKMMGATSVH